MAASLAAAPDGPDASSQSGRSNGPQNGHTKGSLTELVSEPHHLGRWARRHLRPRRRIFYEPHARGYLFIDSRAHRKHRHGWFEPDPSAWVAADIARDRVPPLPRVLPRLILADLLSISWQVAMWFTVGCVAWIVNGQYFVWPRGGDPALSFNLYITAYSGLAGGLCFWVGAYLAVVEALNEHEGADTRVEVRPLDSSTSAAALGAFYVRYGSEIKKKNCDLESKSDEELKKESSKGKRRWRWWGAATSSLGWWAATIQFAGATSYTVSVITGLPGVLRESQWRVMIALVWAAQVFGSIAFLLSSALLMLEEQQKWWKPAFERIGWHSAVWNVIGAGGFLLSAIFGWLGTWGGGGVCCHRLAPAISTYVGSWAFLFSSVLLLLEAQNPHQARLGAHLRRVAAEAAAVARCDTRTLAQELKEDVESVNAVVQGW